ncbi:MAG: menaquinone biosynthesis protein [Candidatus Omnitrophota bacterium]
MIRLGSIAFINSLPVDLGLRSGAVPCPAELVRGTPAELNRALLNKELEVSPVSALWYAEHQRDLLLLSDLSISSESGVESVLLFSKYPLTELKGKKIAVTGKGRTTPALLEIICQLRYGFKPFIERHSEVAVDWPEGFDALLLIGDEALITKERLKNSDIKIVDLAQEWRGWTGLPIVFAVWAVRREIFSIRMEEVLRVREVLKASKRWGFSHRDDVLAAAEAESKLPKAVLKSYFSRLSYDFGERLKEGMRLYLDFASKCGIIGPAGEFQEISDLRGLLVETDSGRVI